VFASAMSARLTTILSDMRYAHWPWEVARAAFLEFGYALYCLTDSDRHSELGPPSYDPPTALPFAHAIMGTYEGVGYSRSPPKASINFDVSVKAS
jgi:hypothetical protein